MPEINLDRNTTALLIDGQLSRRALGMVFEWAAMRQHLLRENWHLARVRRHLVKIEPLD